MRTQLVAARVVAEALADAAEEPEIENGRITEIAGPQEEHLALRPPRSSPAGVTRSRSARAASPATRTPRPMRRAPRCPTRARSSRAPASKSGSPRPRRAPPAGRHPARVGTRRHKRAGSHGGGCLPIRRGRPPRRAFVVVCGGDTARVAHWLERFVEAQDAGGTYEAALAELRAGRKTSHWMWFVFPRSPGWGAARRRSGYAISSRAEAQAYLAPDPRPAPAESTRVLTDLAGPGAREIFGARTHEAALLDDPVRPRRTDRARLPAGPRQVLRGRRGRRPVRLL